ncbi:hypothetical protein HK405_013958 [Cladochytrium tenue]|nr:hypothetical protein HK405_013958 [Cladochytrium tenue]
MTDATTLVNFSHLAPYPGLTSALEKRTDIKGKTVLITGAGGGIGAEVAKSFAQYGVAHIILTGRTTSKLETTKKALQGSYPNVAVSLFSVDVADKASVAKLFDSIQTPPDFLVNNAGYLQNRAPFLESDVDDYWQGFKTNVLGSILMTHAFLSRRVAYAKANNLTLPPAVVISVASAVATFIPMPNSSGYAASKLAQVRWSEQLPADVDPFIARFITVHPGVVKTDMWEKSEFGDAVPFTEAKLAADFIVWATGPEVEFLNGRFVWVNHDVDDLYKYQDKIVKEDWFKAGITGLDVAVLVGAKPLPSN